MFKLRSTLPPRTIVLTVLLCGPVMIYLVLGGLALWQQGIAWWVWWGLPVCWGFTWLLARIWPARPLSVERLHPEPHWTERDRAATLIVRSYQEKVHELLPNQIGDPHFVIEELTAMARELSRHYHPDAKAPLDELTVPEVLAALRLAIDDMERWTLESAPGSRLLTIRQWRAFRHAPRWAKRVQDMGWLAWILLNPANLGLYLSSKYTTQPVMSGLGNELLAILYTQFLRQIGFYLIEMNSGRLRGGADAYRAAFAGQGTPAESQPAPEATSLTLAVVGQVSAGKSSVINALQGEYVADVDLLPKTKRVHRYRFVLGSSETQMTLLDTPGYGDSGATPEQLEEICSALREAHAGIVMMDGHSPAREADRRVVNELLDWYASQPSLKVPPLIGVLSHVDLLPPPLVWEPPYDWRNPASDKAEQIAEAINYTEELFERKLAKIVPVCLAQDAGRAWGISEEVLPALLEVLDEARGVAMLHGFERQLDEAKFRTLLRQSKSAAAKVFRAWLDNP